jgi:hypothetical protein
VVVGDNRKLVSRNVVSAPDNEISEVAADETLWPHMPIHKRDSLSVGHPKAPVHAGGMLKTSGVGSRTTLSRVDGLVVRIVRRSCRLRQFLA